MKLFMKRVSTGFLEFFLKLKNGKPMMTGKSQYFLQLPK